MPLSRINTQSIANNTIIAADLVQYSISANLIANGAITSTQIASNTLSNTVFQTGSVENYMGSQGTSFGIRNKIINGSMAIDQRSNGASVTATTSAPYTLDRWYAFGSVDSKFTVQRDSSANTVAGFANSLKVVSSSAYTVGSAEQYNVAQVIEGSNIADLAWGTASAKTVTLSFWVRSSLTGTFGGSLRNVGTAYSYPFSYTIVAADTWEQKVITIAGPTSGTWGSTNGVGTYVNFSMGAGSTLVGTAGSWSLNNYTSATGATSVVGTSGATWYLTGVQLEKGSQATPFEFRPYGKELMLCQRYYYRTVPVATADSGNGFCTATTNATVYTQLPVQMRTNPTALEQSGTASDYTVRVAAGAVVCSSVPAFQGGTSQMVGTNLPTASGLTAGQGCGFRAVNTNAYLGWSAEL
jgi:hypothetical protein